MRGERECQLRVLSSVVTVTALENVNVMDASKSSLERHSAAGVTTQLAVSVVVQAKCPSELPRSHAAIAREAANANVMGVK